MSNFQTLSLISEGNTSTAPSIFIASTSDSLGTITTAGYMNDIAEAGVVKPNDVLYINYSDTSTFPLNTGEASTLGEFKVSYSDPNWTIATVLTGLGQAAAKDVTDNTKTYVASVDGAPASYTVGALLLAGDTNGSIGTASGYSVANLQRYTTVAITAAQFNGMYAAPKLLVAAPGANVQLILKQVQLVMTYVSANYAAGGVVAVQYDSTANGAGIIASTTLSAATFQAAASTTFTFNAGVVPLTFTTTVNKGFYLSNVTGAFTTGDSTFVAHIWYQQIATV
jgi:hypothetical protein